MVPEMLVIFLLVNCPKYWADTQEMATYFACFWCLLQNNLRIGLQQPIKAFNVNWSPNIYLQGTFWGLWITGVTSNYSPDLWGQSCQVSASLCVSRRRPSPPEGYMQRMWGDDFIFHSPLRTILWGTQSGQLNRLLRCLCFWHSQSNSLGCFGVPYLVTLAPFGESAWVLVPELRIVTWLILPVVICLSQRLSHACLSISNYTAKLRMAH